MGPAVPLFAVVSRMDPQKGIDLVPSALRRLRQLPWQLVILGTGEPELEESVRVFGDEFPDRVRAEFSVRRRLARQIYAGADISSCLRAMSRAVCRQMIAMRTAACPLSARSEGSRTRSSADETGS